jgi:hypothetical protein
VRRNPAGSGLAGALRCRSSLVWSGHAESRDRFFAPLWELLDAETSELVRKGNYERLFDAANARVRAWEAAQLGGRARPAADPNHRP